MKDCMECVGLLLTGAVARVQQKKECYEAAAARYRAAKKRLLEVRSRKIVNTDNLEVDIAILERAIKKSPCPELDGQGVRKEKRLAKALTSVRQAVVDKAILLGLVDLLDIVDLGIL